MLGYLLRSGGLLWLALVLLEPDVGFTAPRPWMALFWALQIGLGLAVLEFALLALTRVRASRPWPTWWLVPASGLLGSVVLAPIYWLLGEGMMVHWLGFPAWPDDDGDVLPAVGGWASVWLAEFGDIVGPVSACWCLVCLPRLHWLVPPLMVPDSPPLSAPAPTPPPADGAGPAPEPGATDWRGRLPKALGRDVIAVTSELQYLRVWTPRGVALVLGSLAEVEAAGRGSRVHRSWWVADAHVMRLQRKGDRLACLTSGGLEVPVSRRRRAEVVARYGDSARYAPP